MTERRRVRRRATPGASAELARAAAAARRALADRVEPVLDRLRIEPTAPRGRRRPCAVVPAVRACWPLLRGERPELAARLAEHAGRAASRVLRAALDEGDRARRTRRSRTAAGQPDTAVGCSGSRSSGHAPDGGGRVDADRRRRRRGHQRAGGRRRRRRHRARHRPRPDPAQRGGAGGRDRGVVGELAARHRVDGRRAGAGRVRHPRPARGPVRAAPVVARRAGGRPDRRPARAAGRRSSTTRTPRRSPSATSARRAGAATVVFVALGTGIGSALLLDGELFRGAFGVAPELGHLRVVPDGRPCPCGKNGCWERYCSGTALATTAVELLARDPGRSPVLRRLVAGDQRRVTGQRVAAAARDGDPVACAAMAELAPLAGRGAGAGGRRLRPRAGGDRRRGLGVGAAVPGRGPRALRGDLTGAGRPPARPDPHRPARRGRGGGGRGAAGPGARTAADRPSVTGRGLQSTRAVVAPSSGSSGSGVRPQPQHQPAQPGGDARPGRAAGRRPAAPPPSRGRSRAPGPARCSVSPTSDRRARAGAAAAARAGRSARPRRLRPGRRSGSGAGPGSARRRRLRPRCQASRRVRRQLAAPGRSAPAGHDRLELVVGGRAVGLRALVGIPVHAASSPDSGRQADVSAVRGSGHPCTPRRRQPGPPMPGRTARILAVPGPLSLRHGSP